MVDWFFDELPYWIMEIEYHLWMLTVLFVKYLVEGFYAIWKASRAAIKLLMKDN